MNGLPDLIRKHLDLKILIVLTICVAAAMGAIISISVNNQRQQIKERMTDFGHELNSFAYASIKHPMSVGDSASVQKQLLDIRDQLHGTEIAICDFNQRIVFATHGERIGTMTADFIRNPDAMEALGTLLKTGNPPFNVSFEEEVDGSKYLVNVYSIRNENECHHCHGATRKVLGGLLTRQSTDATYAAIASLRNKTIAITVVGIGFIIALVYLMLARLVTKPVTELAAKAKQLAGGDLTVSVPVRSQDDIGVLGNAFNSMVQGIKDQIEFANSLKKAIADPLFIVDLNMVVTYMNDACAQLTGYSREETEGKLTCSEIFHSDICNTNCPVRHCIEEGKPTRGITSTITNRAGIRIPVMTSASALRDADGTIVGSVEVCRDITAVLEAERLQYIKKTAEREEEQRKYLETRATALLDVLAQVSDGNLKVRVAPSGQQGVMDKLAHHTNYMLDNLEKLYDKISSFSRELELEVAKRTMMLRERTLLLEKANRELRELDRLKSSFLANMSHELRTPMNSIIGYTDLLLDRVDGEINKEQEKSLLKVANNSKHLLQLINDILDMSKIESGKIELSPQEIDITRLIEATASTFKPALEEKNLTLTYDFAENLPKAFVDDDKTRQILTNLLSNAVKFTDEGGITIHVSSSELGIRPGEDPLFLEICVEDKGIGIRKRDLDKLFDKFSQIDVSTIRQYEGTGLGLSIARGLVVLHKGVIWVESEFGKGTRMCFTLPVRKELFDKPARPVIEPLMAEKLADYFNKPVETFLKEPTYGGKPIRCWEYSHCGQTSCPAYGSREHRCWLIPGTHCKGTVVAKFPEKAEFCKACEVLEQLILSEEAIEMNHLPEKNEQRDKIVLAIDDNPEAIELIRKNIGPEYTVIGVTDSEEAVNQARKIRPDAITLDIMMPRVNGWQVLQDLKNTPETQNIPVIIISIVDEKNIGFSLGATEYIVKPINKELLLQKLQNLEKHTPITRVLIVDQDAPSRELMTSVLSPAGCEVAEVNDGKEALAAIAGSKPDLIIISLTTTDTAPAFQLIEQIRAGKETRDISFILITSQDLTSEEIERLNGGIRAILNRGLLSEKDLADQLNRIINRKGGAAP